MSSPFVLIQVGWPITLPVQPVRPGFPASIEPRSSLVPAVESRAVSAMNAIVYIAARAHVMQGTPSGSLEASRRVDVDGTLALARQRLQQELGGSSS
jgi:hypothetical protein